MSYTTQQIAQLVAGQLTGPGDITVSGMETLDRAGPDQLTFVGGAKFIEAWDSCKARAALVKAGLTIEPGDGRALIVVEDVDLATARVLEALAPPPVLPEIGVHESAVVDATARIGNEARIGPGSVVGPDTRIGDGAVIHANVTVMDACQIGAGCVLWPGVVVRERCCIGDGSVLHPNVTIGSDGFGYRPDPSGQGLIKIPQIGRVVIGRGVEIGSGTCVDRGKFSATEIGDGTKIDNLVQIAHNCRIGRCVVIAGGCGIAGSVTIGDGAMLGGNVGIRDHVTIGPGAQIAAYAAVMKDVPAGATWAGYPAREAGAALREHAAIRKLPGLIGKLKKL